MADNEAADVHITNGGHEDSSVSDNSAPRKAEIDASAGNGDDRLKARIEELETEKQNLVKENEEIKAAKAEREEMERAMESITKRAFELEGEVSRLQHDLGTAMNGGEEAGREIERLVAQIEELKKEKSALSEKVSQQGEELEKSRSDSKIKITDLEKKIEELQKSESEAKREKSAAEEQAKSRLDEMEKKVALLEEEKTLIEDAMGALRADQAELKKSEGKLQEMGQRIVQLAHKAEESEKKIAAQRGIDEAGEQDGSFSCLNKINLPVAGAVSAAVVVAAAAVFCVKYNKAR